ncbi:histidine ammonia-lyase [Dokdonia sp. Hel_I_53]|uniref:histidine ammonia-lyase n=1 Tax=Dokdonia sp. Hel_I_53 TaxID=1566287 RepID=UPI00119C45B7|nr:histidine ammonia-lyase [Dokdonia sp. Hel_I_53]TVZ51463.1 histidine ammonia-lyase [Dokdonia sp. Hel_I_53]
MSNTHYISSELLNLEKISSIINDQKKIALSEESRHNINSSRAYLDKKITESTKPVYGVNTGFGSLCNVAISDNNLTLLQENLVRSHACGTGTYVPKEIVKLMILLKIQSLSYGHSGVHLDTVQRLIDFYNLDILPVIYEQGSLGASGDLAPLAHLALPLINEGQVWDGDMPVSAQVYLQKFNFKPIHLKSKEGLALLNGTQFMTAYGVFSLLKSHKLSYLSDVIGAISLDAFDCNLSPFDPLVHFVRPHTGQIKTAERVMSLLNSSEIAATEKTNVQDPYSFRCIPQVHGATKDVIQFVTKTFKTEINSVTDNPNIFPHEDRIISGGNFHGQPLALGLDFLAVAMAELGSISERRVYQLISGLRGLPPFLVDSPGLNSGMMIPQYTAASIVSQNKQLCTPSSVDSIVSSNGQEDHVSMGANAATKLLKVVDNIETLLSIELLNATQALHFRLPLKTASFLESFVKGYRENVAYVTHDRIFSNDIQKGKDYLKNIAIDPQELY